MALGRRSLLGLVPGARLKVTFEGKVMNLFNVDDEVNILFPCKAPIK